MHQVVMPQWAIDRALERRGTLHPYADLDPRTTALVVVDLQNCFMVEDVGCPCVPYAAATVPNVNRLAATVRATGGKVFWVKNTIDASNIAGWSHWFDSATPEMRKRRIANMAPGSRGHELYPDLDVKPEDEIVQKYRFSAFIQGASDLPQRLVAQGIDTVLITGTVTNVCCESSARDAMMLNFRTVMVSDGNAAMTDAEHNATLATFYAIFGDVMDTDFLIACLERNAGRRAA